MIEDKDYIIEVTEFLFTMSVTYSRYLAIDMTGSKLCYAFQAIHCRFGWIRTTPQHIEQRPKTEGSRQHQQVFDGVGSMYGYPAT